MPDLRRDLKPIPFFHFNFPILKDHRGFTFEDEEELPCKHVIVQRFRATGRDTFLYHAYIIAFEQVPAIADLAPRIMFGSGNGNGLHVRR